MSKDRFHLTAIGVGLLLAASSFGDGRVPAVSAFIDNPQQQTPLPPRDAIEGSIWEKLHLGSGRHITFPRPGMVMNPDIRMRQIHLLTTPNEPIVGVVAIWPSDAGVIPHERAAEAGLVGLLPIMSGNLDLGSPIRNQIDLPEDRIETFRNSLREKVGLSIGRNLKFTVHSAEILPLPPSDEYHALAFGEGFAEVNGSPSEPSVLEKAFLFTRR